MFETKMVGNWPDPAQPGFPGNLLEGVPHMLMNRRSGQRVWCMWGVWLTEPRGEGYWRSATGQTLKPLIADTEWVYVGPGREP
jgi:hypothetical protein